MTLPRALRPTLAALVLAALAVTTTARNAVFSGDFSWTNGAGGNWNVANNWTPVGVPLFRQSWPGNVSPRPRSVTPLPVRGPVPLLTDDPPVFLIRKGNV